MCTFILILLLYLYLNIQLSVQLRKKVENPLNVEILTFKNAFVYGKRLLIIHSSVTVFILLSQISTEIPVVIFPRIFFLQLLSVFVIINSRIQIASLVLKCNFHIDTSK